jgi:hypothetical protein
VLLEPVLVPMTKEEEQLAVETLADCSCAEASSV